MPHKQKGGMICPHCQGHITASEVAQALFGNWKKSGRKKIPTQCQYGCGYEGGVREMQAHIVTCPKRTYPSETARKIALTKARNHKHGER